MVQVLQSPNHAASASASLRNVPKPRGTHLISKAELIVDTGSSTLETDQFQLISEDPCRLGAKWLCDCVLAGACSSRLELLHANLDFLCFDIA